MANTQPHAIHATCLHRGGRREGEQRRGRRRRRHPRCRGRRRCRRGARVVPRHQRGDILAAAVRAARQTAALGEEVGQLGGRGRRHGGAPVTALAVGRHGDGRLLQ